MFVDTHAHLFYPNFTDDLDLVLERAKEQGIEAIVVPATDLKTAESVLNMVHKYPYVYGAVGIHPHDSKDWDSSQLSLMKELCAEKKIVAIGEIGLDYYYDFSPREIQRKAFTDQLNLALELDLPVIIHNRDSDEDMMNIIRDYAGTGLRAQFHCFNGSAESAKELQNMHHFISFTGNITFKKFDSLREVVKSIDLNNLMLETDSPFMTPVPFRGKRNEPSYIKYIAETIAKVKNLSAEYVSERTTLNAFRFFGINKSTGVTLTYKIGNSLYINVTNRCNADCKFCARKENPVLNGYNLAMQKSDEPSAEVYIAEIGDPKQFKEIVFCGYGEPTIRWQVVKDIAEYVVKNGGKTRINTNGHGNIINKRDITAEMPQLINTVSISLNTTNREEYAQLMGVDSKMFDAMTDFALRSKNNGIEVVMTAVDYDSVDLEKARDFAENVLGVNFRVREYF